MTWLLLIISLLIILLAAEMFTNAVEWFGIKLKLGSGAVGSILAAVGTALPETMIPIVAIATRGGEGEARAGEHMGIGAILGAPFMLSTLAMFVTGLAVVLYHRTRKRPIYLTHHWSVFRRDLQYFLICFILAVGAAFVIKPVQFALGALLIIAYGIYAWKTIVEESGHLEAPGPLHLHNYILHPISRRMTRSRPVARDFASSRREHGFIEHMSPHMSMVIIQLIASLSLIIIGAQFFVTQIGKISVDFGIPALVLALVIAPIATELPEKFNSVLWIGQKKDTLALGNITGAMVFQSAFPVTVGLWFTKWDLMQDTHAMVAAVITLIAGIYLISLSYLRKRIEAWWLMLPGLLYLAFLVDVIWF